jgi:aminoglycoside 3-N-acetyltransferase
MRVPAWLSGLEPPVKRFRHRVRTAYIKRFHTFTPTDLRAMLRSLGVQTGDILCIHSSFDRFLGFQGHFGDALQTLRDAVGPSGGILMPTQPFSGSAISYVRTHPVTDIARAPSLMGILTEILRRTPGAIRSIHPTHPVAAWGDKGVDLVGNDWQAATPCGRGTAYHRLLEADGKILLLGTGVQPMTFYHCVEELIEPLMPFSPFTAEAFTLQTKDGKGNLYASHMRLFEPVLSAKRRMSLLVPELKRRGCWRQARVGRLDSIVLRATDVLDACRSMANRGRFCYLLGDEPSGQGPASQALRLARQTTNWFGSHRKIEKTDEQAD